jgi:hypothetical protein
MTRATVLSCHVNSDALPDLTETLDGVAKQFARRSDFRGLVYLEDNNARHKIVIITLWEDKELEDTQAEAELARERIAATTDMAVSSRCYSVVRLVPGALPLDGFVVHPLASMKLTPNQHYGDVAELAVFGGATPRKGHLR